MDAYTEGPRPAILDLLKIGGPANAPELARALGVRPTAARQQLAVLHRDGLVAVAEERRPRGRPTHVWSLTPKAHALFPQASGPVAVSLLRQLRDLDGDAKVDRLFARRSRELAKDYLRRLAGKRIEAKVAELARIRDEEGYVARAEGACLREHHCPIAAIAREFPSACRHEKLLFEAVLGRKLERTSHIASGGRACVYRPRS